MEKRVPALRRHKRSGHAYARFNGRQVWFGPYGSPSTHECFARTLAEWRANGGSLPLEEEGVEFTVADVVAAYLEFASTYYRGPDGRPTRELEHLEAAVRPLLGLYGTLTVNELGPRQLKTLRGQLIASGLARKTINDRVNRIVRAIGWAAEEELCRPEVFGGLKAVRPLVRGRSGAKEGRRVLPVSREHVDEVLSHVSKPVAGMIEIMWHTGMRPGEACQLRPIDLDTSGAVWLYRPSSHKSERFGRDRVIAIGPRGQETLCRFLSRLPRPAEDAPLFSPHDAMADLHAERREERQTPLWPSHKRAIVRKRKEKPNKRPGEAYTPNSLLGAIKRACKTAGIPSWSPNQLRHAAATRIRKELGLDTARAVLGHTSAAITELYAERDIAVAQDAASKLG